MASTPQDSGGPLRHLNRLLSEDNGQQQRQQQTSDSVLTDALAPFTDTLFYDWDLGRVMDPDGLDCRLGVEGSSKTGSSSSYGDGLAIGAGEEDDEDFFEGASARDQSQLGYDFLNFKFPPTAPRHQQEHQQLQSTRSSLQNSAPTTQYRQQNPLSSSPPKLVLDTADTSLVQRLNGAISPHDTSSAAPVASPFAPESTPMMSSSSSPTSPMASNYTFPPLDHTHHHQQQQQQQQHRDSLDPSSASPPPHSHHHQQTVGHSQHGPISESDAHILSIQESARLAADEDKRRRNTAASARFRIKKKQRDQAIEKAAKEMADRVSDLEKKISTLELENRWLRNLLVEKNTSQSADKKDEYGRAGGGGGRLL